MLLNIWATFVLKEICSKVAQSGHTASRFDRKYGDFPKKMKPRNNVKNKILSCIILEQCTLIV